MKHLVIKLLLVSVPFLTTAQGINWKNSTSQSQHMVYLNFGYDFAMTTQIGYGYQPNSTSPIWLTIDYSIPMGNQITDDFKSRLGGQITLFEKNDFVLTTRAYGIVRGYQSDFVRMVNFGAEVSGSIGYYRPKWHVQTTLGFDKAISTNLKHLETLNDQYPAIQDGWYLPTGGHWFYGIQAGRSLCKNFYLSLNLGIINAQGEDQNPLLARYFQLSFMKSF